MKNFNRFALCALWLAWISGCSPTPLYSQKSQCMDPEFHEKVHRTISGSIPTMDAAELKEKLQNLRIFDAREREEYEVSHIPGAEYIGYKNFDIKSLANIPKDTPIVLYCSIGYRSEKIGEKLQAKGFTNVFNLYGSIFEWVNRGYPVVNSSGEEVKKVHTYNKEWSRWVDENQAQKIW